MRELLFAISSICFFTLSVRAQITITATSTPATFTNNGSITIVGTGLPNSTVYGIVKEPFDVANILSSTTPVFNMLEPGNYFYGYYDGSIFIKKETTINVVNKNSTISPTFTQYEPIFNVYCGTDPLIGRIEFKFTGGNGPYTIDLLDASNTIVDKQEGIELAGASVLYSSFYGVSPGDYKLRATDACGTIVTTPNSITLQQNIQFSGFYLRSNGNVPSTDGFKVVYNTPNDVCSGIASASIVNVTKLLPTLVTYLVPSGTVGRREYHNIPDPVYKLEIQNASGGFDVYDNIPYTGLNSLSSGEFPLPLNRDLWGLVRLSVTLCGSAKTVQLNLANNSYFKIKLFSWISANIYDDPANTTCIKTGKVSMKLFLNSGCLPIVLTITENGTTNVQHYTIASYYSYPEILLDIGKRYTVNLVDDTGAVATSFSFNNATSALIKLNQSNPLDLYINPDNFTPNPNIRDQITFVDGASARNIGKSAMVIKGIYKGLNLVGNVTVKSISGPKVINKTISPESISVFPSNFGILIDNTLDQGTYVIKVKDEGCFEEEYTVVVESYIQSITLQNVTYTPSTQVCNRYEKRGEIHVNIVGRPKLQEEGFGFIRVGLTEAPVGFSTAARISSPLELGIAGGVFPFSFPADISGDYKLALTRYAPSSLLVPLQVLETTSVVPLQVLPNFPAFDLAASGGVICFGSTTGTLTVKVDNTIGVITYFIKKESDVSYPVTGQTSPIFTDLSPGNYEIKAKTACYEVVQAFVLSLVDAVTDIVVGNKILCAGEALHLLLLPLGPLDSVKWTLPNGSVVDASQLDIDNVTLEMSGTYKVEIVTKVGCSFTESVIVTVKPRANTHTITVTVIKH